VASGLFMRYGAQSVLEDISFALSSSSRVALVGPNGAGKSTLLKILAGALAPDAGMVDQAATVVLGYLDQEQEALPQSPTLFEFFRGERPGDREEQKAELLSYGFFTYPDLLKPVGALSVGQKRKLQIARLIARRANLLLLDEPTNHISLDVLEEFEAALLHFPGPVIAVSHDRRFLQKFPNEIWELQEGKLTRHLGTWQQYRERTAAQAALAKE
jgi:macrolide transport system ATP-binding/permease protein